MQKKPLFYTKSTFEEAVKFLYFHVIFFYTNSLINCEYKSINQSCVFCQISLSFFSYEYFVTKEYHQQFHSPSCFVADTTLRTAVGCQMILNYVNILGCCSGLYNTHKLKLQLTLIKHN